MLEEFLKISLHRKPIPPLPLFLSGMQHQRAAGAVGIGKNMYL